MGKVVSTIVLVVVAVAVSGGLWVGANLIFNQVRDRWSLFNALVFALGGFTVVAVLHGNGILRFDNDGFWNWIWPPALATVGAAALGLALAATEDPRKRMLLSAVGVGALGAVLGLLVDEGSRPALAIGPLIGWTVAGVVIGGGLSALRRRPPLGGALIGGAIGWIAGAWGAADLGEGSVVEAAIALGVPAVALGVRLGLTRNPDLHGRAAIDLGSRSWIFLAPALFFIGTTLVVPAIRTVYLSLFDARSENFVGLENYGKTFTDPVSFNASNWTNIFGSRLFWIGLGLLVIGIAVALRQRKETGRAVELGGPSLGPLVGAGLFLAFALFTAFRGTVINNLWWVVVVTCFSTGLGLAVAVLADNRRGEKVAKSIIFMPMAISLVGASIIWRFMYIPRDISVEQTGVLNALWVGLGRLSTGSGLPTLLVGILSLVVFALLLVPVARALTRRTYGKAVVPGILALLVGWFTVRYWGVIGGGVGGHQFAEDGTVRPQTIEFIQESPFNNFWLMVILIWIQTGFAMVILSAAIKAVPTEFVEAARVDGATDSQIFWRIVLPQIATTIGVVVTTIVVLVMKVFDIVKVVTNGNFGTQVLANDMFQQAFQFSNIGRGAALAILILVSVLPVMYTNIRRMQKEN
jgi:alpha-glucoside transport system permease protein